MRTLALLFLSVIAGWTVCGVDWSREAVGEEAPIDPGTRSANLKIANVAGRESSDSARRLSPAELLVGRWRDHFEPDDAVIELLSDGTGTITNDNPKDAFVVNISWSIGSTYENACLVNLKYEQSKEEGAKPLPPEAKPFKMLAVFDGDDRFVFQRGPNDITTMDRQLPKTLPEDKTSSSPIEAAQ